MSQLTPLSAGGPTAVSALVLLVVVIVMVALAANRRDRRCLAGVYVAW